MLVKRRLLVSFHYHRMIKDNGAIAELGYTNIGSCIVSVTTPTSETEIENAIQKTMLLVPDVILSVSDLTDIYK